MTAKKYFIYIAALLTITSVQLFGAASPKSVRKNINIMFIGDSYTYGSLAEGVTSTPYPLQTLKYLNDKPNSPLFSFSAFGLMGSTDSSVSYEDIQNDSWTADKVSALSNYQSLSCFHGLLAIPRIRYSDINYLLNDHSFNDIIAKVNYGARGWVKMISNTLIEAPEFNAKKLMSSPVIQVVVLWLGTNDMAENVSKTEDDIIPYEQLVKKLYSALDESKYSRLVLLSIPEIAVKGDGVKWMNFRLFNNVLKDFYKQHKTSYPKLLFIDLNDTSNPAIAKFNNDWTSQNYDVYPANAAPYADISVIVSKEILSSLSST
ncbi:MAG: SGNH/GDSL hydrolase family protein [Lentisphaerae bacterium]|nr:SGNH/GDSL hydrolase family protein [Lentisphaerota bacterium]MCP4101946.1 SGNH/GDSL hydrolase family protein [Lentisphaerota bacterium]